MSSVQEDVVRENLRLVVDPELGVNIIDLGLVYGIDIADSNVTVRMTLTSPACPLGPVIQGQAHAAVKQLPWVKDVSVELVCRRTGTPESCAAKTRKCSWVLCEHAVLKGWEACPLRRRLPKFARKDTQANLYYTLRCQVGRGGGAKEK